MTSFTHSLIPSCFFVFFVRKMYSMQSMLDIDTYGYTQAHAYYSLHGQNMHANCTSHWVCLQVTMHMYMILHIVYRCNGFS